MRGVVAAGHPLTAEAGADVLRAGGNAVDAAVAAVLMSFVAEPPLTGPGRRRLHGRARAAARTHVLDFFVAAPGLGLEDREPAELVPIDVRFSEDAVQRFNIGPASCGAYGTTLGLAETLRRFGTRPPRRPHGRAGAGRARGRRGRADAGVPVHGARARSSPRRRSAPRSTRPEGRLLREGDTIRAPELGDLLDRLGAEGPGFLYTATSRTR